MARKIPKWQHILNLEARAKGLPAPYLSPDDDPPMPSGSLPRPEVLGAPPSDKHVQQIAGDVRMARNVGLAFLLGKAVPALFALWLIWLFFGKH
ncbi:hypothetical protein BDS110ZK4_27300 [Bradyrhizobium diazoefficiens]|uniref:Uncharacterized protein n=2 Tax=Bradyrhizobium TaxID=374 RepID=A0A809X5V7_9BRAD|nr:hypothetical protein XF1B_48640 [Bradyrhizobium diazoefficiens]BCE48448.1 hypothetical protein XF4B_47970 [Bradyrhizobium diazoefficiens]BCE91964.1 hypothetical protein XF10B_47620 [Bradyrhizobium diazoefficiens]BCF26892.1 hypothetical protein XF14B_48440 [Bradyrhizobium diazoefficiens]